ncbi:hypothetical protein ANN_05591 [Periplaneta americana]|uniref:Uncharacterized protein n=1 Tax=Periplaneta americana TaxID=6978 RepID=A0ABQ8TDA9_PERAM|nr:hypothetical protein ANN_05591 [Periplaneta americana]
MASDFKIELVLQFLQKRSVRICGDVSQNLGTTILQNGPEVHSASYKIEYRVFPGGKRRSERGATTPPHSSAEVMESMGLYLHAPKCLHGMLRGYLYLYYYYYGNGITQIGDYLWYYGEGNDHHQIGTRFFIHSRIKLAVKKVEFISDRLSYLVLKGRWCDIVVINAHAPTEEKDDHIKDSFYEELEETFDQLPRYQSLLSKNVKVRIYKTVILPVVLYGCETWTLILREEQRVRVFENKVLRKIFGAKRDEVTGEWRKLHNTELHALYSSPDIIRNIKSRRLRWAGHVALYVWANPEMHIEC